MGSQNGDSDAKSSHPHAQSGGSQSGNWRARGSQAGNSQAGGSQTGGSQTGDEQASGSQVGSSSRTGAPRRQFRPMDAIVVNRVALTEEEKAARKARGFSENYMGDYTNDKNKSADIPDEKNCSLYITGLPLDVTVKDIFDDIRDIGKVFSLHISPPKEGKSKRAAAIVFFTRAAAGKQLQNSPSHSIFRH